MSTSLSPETEPGDVGYEDATVNGARLVLDPLIWKPWRSGDEGDWYEEIVVALLFGEMSGFGAKRRGLNEGERRAGRRWWKPGRRATADTPEELAVGKCSDGMFTLLR